MAAITAFVSLYVDLLVRPHPGYERGRPIVTFGWSGAQSVGAMSRELVDQIAEESVTLEAAAGVMPTFFQMGADRERVFGEMVTREFFEGIRPKLALGRGFEPREHNADGEPVIVISHAFWQARFDGRDDVLGRTIEINGMDSNRNGREAAAEGGLPGGFRVVGVMGARFTGTLGPSQDNDVAFWVPVEQGIPVLQVVGRDGARAMTISTSMRGIGRRASGASAAAVSAELNSKFAEAQPPAGTSGVTQFAPRFDVLNGFVFNTRVQRNTQRQLHLFLGASALLLIVAAANTGLFLFARAPGRQRELGIRMAVGAPVRRIARQLASESSVLVLASAVLGVALSVWLAEYLRGSTLLRDAHWIDVTLLDWRVLGTVGAFVLAMGILVSLAPILALKRHGISGSSRQVSARATVAQRTAGAAQIALAGALGGAAIAFGWYLSSLMFGHPGFEIRNLQVVDLLMPRSEDIRMDNARRRDALLSVPGIENISMAGAVPGFRPSYASMNLSDPGDPERQFALNLTSIDRHYVDLLGLRVVHGRSPMESDDAVALVNQALASDLWGHEDVVGERLPWSLLGQSNVEVVGVLEDLSYEHPAAGASPIVFMSGGSGQTRGLALIETSMTSAQLRQALQDSIDSGVLEMTVRDVQSLRSIRSALLADDRVRSFLTIAATMLVIALSVFGFYGTQRYLVEAGRREYAIRASLGASPRNLGRLVLRRAFLLGLPGLVLGLPLAFTVVAWLRDDFVSREVSPMAISISVAVGLAALVIAASLPPARHAQRTHPAPLLRED